MDNKLEIKKLGINGEGIGYINNKITFVYDALPGDVIEIKNLMTTDRYNTAEVAKYIKKSANRIKPACRIWDKCQVCSIMPLDYSKQVEAKKEYLINTMHKYNNLKFKIDKIVKADDIFHYRNSIKLPFFNLRDKLAIGIHFRDTNHYVNLNNCIIQKKEINETLRALLDILDEYRYRAYDRKTKLGLRFLLMRAFGDEVMITLVVGKNTKLVDEAIEKIMKIKNVVSLNISTNTKASNEIIVEPIKNVAGKKSINVPFNKFNFKLSPESFIQLNTAQAIKLYDLIKEYLGNDNKLVLDLYTGVGTIACYIADQAEEIIAIDLNKQAIKDAKENAKKHRLNNIKFVAGDVDEKIKTYTKDAKVDAIIVDPPRVGLSEYTMESIIRSKTKKLIYVSCNPATLAKDLKVLGKYYEVEKISLVDMFPNTMHVETVALLTRKK